MFFRFKIKLLIFFVILLFSIQAISFFTVSDLWKQSVEEEANYQLSYTSKLFKQQFDKKTQTLSQQLTVLASDFGFRQAISSADQATIQSTIVNLHQRMKVDRTILIDLNYEIRADTLDPENIIAEIKRFSPQSVDIAFLYKSTYEDWQLIVTTLTDKDDVVVLKKQLNTLMEGRQKLKRINLSSAEFLSKVVSLPNITNVDNNIVTMLQYSLAGFETSLKTISQYLLISLIGGLVLTIIGGHLITSGVANPVISVAQTNQRGLQMIANSTEILFRQHSLEQFANIVLEQIDALLGFSADKLMLLKKDDLTNGNIQLIPLAGTGKFEQISRHHIANDREGYALINKALMESSHQFTDDKSALFIITPKNSRQICIYTDAAYEVSTEILIMIDAYINKLAIAFDNLFLLEEIRETNESLEERVVERMTALEQVNEKLKHQSSTDELTGLWNRRHFLSVAEQLLSQSARSDDQISIIMVDADKFKLVNDNYGHDVGDEVLRCFAQKCVENIRDKDLVARVGGEEFIILLPTSNIDQVMQTAERIRLQIEAMIILLETTNLSVTASFGVTTQCDSDKNISQLVKRADKALYQAKHQGRNQVVLALPEKSA